MYQGIISKLDKRTRKVTKNILASLLFKGSSIFISLILVPLTLSYLNSYEYGVWLTLSSILSWIYILDIGLGNGLRNKLTEALALNDFTLAKIYVSTTFFVLGFFSLIVYVVFLILQHWLDWYIILNVDPNKVSNLGSIVAIVFAFFCASFILKTIGNIYMAYQQSAINDLLLLLGNVVSLMLIYVCTLFFPASLGKVAVLFSAAPVAVFLLATPLTFLRYKEIRPSWTYLQIKYLKKLMSLGGQFFIIQMSCIVIFMTSNLVISQLFGPDQVTPYNIAFKYFSIISIGFTIVLSPLWSAVTDAYIMKDINWIRSIVRRIFFLWGICVFLTVIMVVFSSLVYKLWVGDDVVISTLLSVVCGVYVTIYNWNNIFAYMLNGLGKIRLQLYSSIISGVLFFPLAHYFGERLGIAGIMLTMCCCLFTTSIWAPIQFWKIMSNKATGIWNK